MPNGAGRVARALLPGLVCASMGCEAAYDDLRPADVRARDIAFFVDGGPGQGPPDAGGPVDAGAGVDAGGDAGDGADGGSPPAPELLATGSFSGRTGYRAAGTAQLVREADGTLALELLEDFSAQAVPGPIVMLSTRDRIGNRIDPAAGDVELGVLRSNQGAQRYVAPPEAAGARFAWVYCRPFRVEVAVAPLEAP